MIPLSRIFSNFPGLPNSRCSPSVPQSVVDQAIQLLEHRLKSYNVTVKVESKCPLPQIEADPEQLKEVFVNLIVNACEAMVRGGTIVIREEEDLRPPDGKIAVIRVRDNGPGIPESIQDKVLQPFFTTKEEGTGLGLSIAARIIGEHHGHIDIESKMSKGPLLLFHFLPGRM